MKRWSRGNFATRSATPREPAFHALLDKQDRGEPLTEDERGEAEGLVSLADMLTLIRLRAGVDSASPAQ